MDWSSLIDGVGAVAGTALSVGSGGILGLLGSIGGAFLKMRQAKQEAELRREDREHEIRLLDKNMEMMKLRGSLSAEEHESEARLVATQGSYDGLAASIRADACTGDVHKIVNDLKSLFRLILTTMLVAIVTYMFYVFTHADEASNATLVKLFSGFELKEMLRYIVYSTVFTASTACVWWFGDRAFAPPGLKNR